MLKEFINWVLGTLEDYPLPFEIKNVYFCLTRECEYFYLSFGATEIELNHLLNLEFYPLDAQFFDIYKFNKFFNLHDLKLLLQKALKNRIFKQTFKNINIFYGVFGEKEIYLL